MTKVKQMREIASLPISNSPRAPKADITNAPTLFGDPYGDFEEEGDYEDGDSMYGDVINDGSLGAFKTISGDPEGLYGGPNWAQRHKKGLRTAGIVGASALTTAAIAKAIAYKRAKNKRIQNMIAHQRAKQTLANQKIAKAHAGKIDRKQKMPFFQLLGAKLNSSPINPMSGFIADMWKYQLDRQNSDTPFYQETAIATFAAGTWTATTVGVATNRFFTGLILQLGINQLNAAPGTVFTVTATIPTINGVLTVAATPWVFTIENKFDVRFLFFPWQLVSNEALPVLGQYSAANPITVAVTGLPAASTVNLIVPGSLHPWTVAMRNALIH